MFGQYADRLATRAPPPSGQPPRYAFSRYFRANLRPVIIGIGVISFVYALLWGGSSFSNLHFDKSQNLGSIVAFDIAIGSIYMVVALIEASGIYGAIRQSVPTIRLYSILSLVISGIILAAEILRLVVHFGFKSSMISACETAVESDNGDFNNYFGFFGNSDVHNLDPGRAQDFCNDAWSHATFSDIAWLIFSTICSLVFASLAFSYYRQLLDPMSGVARTRPQDNNVPLDTFRNYGQYNEYAQGTGLPYNAGRSSPRPASEYAPPYEASKLPGYGGGYAEDTDPEKKVSDDDKALAGVSH